MKNPVNQLVLYRTEPSGLIARMASIFCEKGGEGREDEICSCLQELAELAETRGFSGSLWHCALAYHLVYHENAFSRACEIRGHVEGSINAIARHDFHIFRMLFHLFDEGGAAVDDTDYRAWLTGTEYAPADTGKRIFNRRISERICTLAAALAKAESDEVFQELMEQFYLEFGVGKFGLHKAFRVQHEGQQAQIIPITNIAHVHLDDLVGYEKAKQQLIENTEAFVAGRQANNCLLFGDAGTGKSSSIKGILNQYYDRGLRIIELYKYQFQDLNSVISQIKNRNYRFIIYMDDLSFEDFETDYKYLKAVIEGGLEKKPDNILIYATSNRRHLIRENYSDKEETRQDMHSSDTVQEKLSLAYRFGVTIYFGRPDKKEFQTIVKTLAARAGIEMPEEELLLQANQWELYHGGLSGRTAQQFVDYLLGTKQAAKTGGHPWH